MAFVTFLYGTGTCIQHLFSLSRSTLCCVTFLYGMVSFNFFSSSDGLTEPRLHLLVDFPRARASKTCVTRISSTYVFLFVKPSHCILSTLHRKDIGLPVHRLAEGASFHLSFRVDMGGGLDG